MVAAYAAAVHLSVQVHASSGAGDLPIRRASGDGSGLQPEAVGGAGGKAVAFIQSNCGGVGGDDLEADQVGFLLGGPGLERGEDGVGVTLAAGVGAGGGAPHDHAAQKRGGGGGWGRPAVAP